MKDFFRPNISRTGRIVRALFAMLLLVGGIIAVQHIVWLGVVLFSFSGLAFFEVARGWCVMRACGIRTKL
jgi:Zn-dependent membrane protease YugP